MDALRAISSQGGHGLGQLRASLELAGLLGLGAGAGTPNATLYSRNTFWITVDCPNQILGAT